MFRRTRQSPGPIEQQARRLATVMVLAAISHVTAGAAGAEICDAALTLDADTVLRGYSAEVGDVEVFALDVPGAGTASLEIAVPGSAPVSAKLDLLGKEHGCRARIPGSAEVVERTANHLVLAVREPGRFLLRAASRDPRRALGSYRLHVRVAVLTKSEPEEIDPDPGFKSEPEEIDPDPGFRGADDDHSDVRHGSTPLVFGRSIAGEIDNDWGDDADVFQLVLWRQTSFEIAAAGEAEISVTVTDARGRRLAVAGGRGEGESFRIADTLPPGRYFLRLEGVRGAEGAYVLTARALEW